jgi:hypothetical protein
MFLILKGYKTVNVLVNADHIASAIRMENHYDNTKEWTEITLASVTLEGNRIVKVQETPEEIYAKINFEE